MFESDAAKILKKLGIENTAQQLQVPPEPKFGDLSFPCFNLAKQRQKPPQEIAQEIAEQAVLPDKSPFNRIASVGGYVNFFVDWENVSSEVLKKILKDGEKFGRPELQKKSKKKIMVEHTSANPNKALHVGHIRNSCLGDSLSRLLSFCGHDVKVANYIDDTGAQIADIIVGFKFLNIPLETEMKFDQYCGNEVYVKVNKLYETMPELVEKKRFVLRQIEDGGNEIAKFAEEIVHRILMEQLKTCWRLGIFYDLLNKETNIIQFKLWEKAFGLLKKGGFIYQVTTGDKTGCWLLKLSELPEFKGMKNPDIVLVRSDGTVLYVGKDVAYAMWKHGVLKRDFNYTKLLKQPNDKALWSTTVGKGVKAHPKFRNVDISINVIDVRQSYEQDAVIAALKLIAGKTKEYTHYDYGLVSLSANTAKQLSIDVGEKEKVQMSGRKGWFINADSVIEALVEKEMQETKKRNAEMAEADVKKIAEGVAVGALRYELTKVSSDKGIVFDLDESLKLEGNTGPYLQYAHTRCCSIIEKAAAEGWKLDLNAEMSVDKMLTIEKLLARTLLQFPEVVLHTAKDLCPHYICNYAYELATTFNNFYQQCPVLKAETKQQRELRLLLVAATKVVLANALNLIVMEALEKM